MVPHKNGRTLHVEGSGKAGRGSDLVQKMLWLCATKNGTKVDEVLQDGENWHKRVRQDVKTSSGP